jgi:hypothetical protein
MTPVNISLGEPKTCYELPAPASRLSQPHATKLQNESAWTHNVGELKTCLVMYGPQLDRGRSITQIRDLRTRLIWS